jgi:hypothetical protein
MTKLQQNPKKIDSRLLLIISLKLFKIGLWNELQFRSLKTYFFERYFEIIFFKFNINIFLIIHNFTNYTY